MCEQLRNVRLNEGIEVLGASYAVVKGERYPGVFQKSGLRSVVLPSTLKKIEYCTFAGCKSLKVICFPEGLEHLGASCF